MSKKSFPKVVSVYACKKKWEQLKMMDGSPARWCSSCKQSVFPVEDIDGFEVAIAQARCVYVKTFDVEIVGLPLDERYKDAAR